MKMLLLLLMFTSIGILETKAQIRSKPIKIENEALRREINNYIIDCNKWMVQNKLSNYILMLSEEGMFDHSILKLNLILFDTELSSSNPSDYTVINNRCVLIRTGMESFSKTDNILLTDLIANYSNGLIKSQTYIEMQKKANEDDIKRLPDTVLVMDKNGPTKVSKNEIRLSVFSPSIVAPYKKPHGIEMDFYHGSLIAKKEIIYESIISNTSAN